LRRPAVTAHIFPLQEAQMSRELFTAREIGPLLRLKPETVRKYARDRIIPSIRLNKKVVRFQLESVLEALTRRAGHDACEPSRMGGRSS